MDFLTLATQRYSVRKFRPEHLSEEDLDRILKAGQCAPTAVNFQPQRILVLNSDEATAKLRTCPASQNHAPCALLVCSDSTRCWKRKYDGKPSGEIDAAIVATHMMLAAQEIGVGCVWVMYFDPVKTREIFAIPPEYEPVAFLMMGYPAEDAQPGPLHPNRLPLEETVFRDHF